MSSELPKQITDGICPILEKYGVTDKTTQGRILVDMGALFREVNTHDVTKVHNQKKYAAQLFHRTIRILNHYGIKDMLKRANCAKEMLEFVAELIKQEAGK